MNKFFILLFIFLGLTIPIFSVLAVTGTIDPVNKYAWSNNIGWINFGCTDCNVTITDSAVTGYAWSKDYGWINFSPTNGGISNDGSGVLSGYAWGKSAGWINFSGVSINSSGQFTGTATGNIVGTINFSCTESGCPVTTDWRQEYITFNPSSNSVGFGALSPVDPRYATSSPPTGSPSETDAITLSISSNATLGYTVTVNGSTLTHGTDTISAIGGTSVASAPGTEQFGMRLIRNSGTAGSVSSPYDTSDWALDTTAFPDQIISGTGDSTTTVFGVRLLCNISPITKPGNYSTTLSFIATANF